MIRRLLVVATALLSASAASAQQWKVDVQGGRIRSTLDPAAGEVESVVAGMGYEDLTTAFRISAGVPTRKHSRYWGALGAWKRLAFTRSGFTGGVDLSGNGFFFPRRTTDPGSGGGLLNPVTPPTTEPSGHAFAGQALPLIGFATGPFQLRARAGMSHYAVTIGDQSRDRTVKLADLQLTLQPAPSVVIAPAIRRLQAENEKASTFVGVSSVIVQGRATLWANAGQWLDGADTVSNAQTAWGVGGSFRIIDRLMVNASARRDGFDPLYLNPPQTSWSVGLSVLVGGRPSRPAAPVPAAYDNGLATIRLPVSAATTNPSVAGDFNSWTPARMERDGKFWSYTVAAAPGVYNYSFVSSDGTWFVPESVPGRKSDGMGGHVAVLVVR